MSAPALLARLRAWLPRGGALTPEAWERRHRGVLVIAWVHVAALLVLMWWRHDLGTSPLGVWAAAVALVAFGGLGRSQRIRASCATMSLLICTALLIHAFDGLIEMHFHFFVVIAIVAMYQLWTPYLVALSFVVAEHALMGLTMPMAVYNHPAAMHHPIRFAMIHGAFVLAESIACLSFWKVNERALDAERDQRQRAEEMSSTLGRVHREISDLLAMLAHDMRTPVTIVTNYAEMTLDAWDQLERDTIRDHVERMGRAGQTLERLLSDTLAMSAHDASGLHSSPTEVRVDAAARLAVTARAADLTVVDLSGLDAATALVDEGQLHQMLTNLLSNAAKYGAPPYAVSTALVEEQVEIRVSDGGPGVAPDFVARLFDRYARADDARLSGLKGTGLGLYIVRQLVEANHGTVEYAVAPGGGACFVMRLARASAAVGPDELDERVLAG